MARGVIKGVLKEELVNSLRMKKNYEQELARLPNGCLVRKKIKGHEYYYIAIRDKKKVRFIYKGKLSDEQIKKNKQAKEYKAKYRKLLSQIKRQIKFLKGSIRGKEAI